MTNYPLVSIIVANYNSAAFIFETLDSIKKQTYPYLDVVIIDDCSKDASPQIIERFLAQDLPGATYIQLEQNIGGGATKKLGIDRAKGEIVCFVDCDDYISPDAIEIMVQAHNDHEACGLVYSNAYRINGSGINMGVLGKAAPPLPGKTILESDNAFHLATWKKTHYDRCAEGFSPKFNIAYDLDLYYKLEEVTKVHFLDLPLYYYRVHEHNLSIGFDKLGRSMAELLVAKYEAQVRRGNVDLADLGLLLQGNFVKIQAKALKNKSLQQRLKHKIKRLFKNI
jgi:glycosyltransferase involved in cell wall biosynthesis